jgi:hypothetical protein
MKLAPGIFRNLRQRLRAAALLLLAAPLVAFADAGGLLVTTVDAQSGRTLAGVWVEVTNRDGASATAVSDERGEARFEELEEGFYSVEARAEGHVLTFEPTFRVIARRVSALEMQLPPIELAMDMPLEEVLVIARARQADDLSGVTGSFRNRDELRNAVGAGSDVMRALDGLPGLASDGAFAAFTVRGRGPRNNLVFVDEFPFDFPERLMDGPVGRNASVDRDPPRVTRDTYGAITRPSEIIRSSPCASGRQDSLVSGTLARMAIGWSGPETSTPDASQDRSRRVSLCCTRYNPGGLTSPVSCWRRSPWANNSSPSE